MQVFWAIQELMVQPSDTIFKKFVILFSFIFGEKASVYPALFLLRGTFKGVSFCGFLFRIKIYSNAIKY